MKNTEYYTYCKFNGEKNFTAYDINEGHSVGNLIYCTLVENTQENQHLLQKLADLNFSKGLVIQLRDGKGNIIFETDSELIERIFSCIFDNKVQDNLEKIKSLPSGNTLYEFGRDLIDATIEEMEKNPSLKKYADSFDDDTEWYDDIRNEELANFCEQFGGSEE